MNRERLLAWALRLIGAVECLAFGAVVMPRSWLESFHAQMGRGEMPPGPVFESVMRQVSVSYGLHGIALLFIAADVKRYRPLLWLSAFGYLLSGPVFILIDGAVGMPGFWLAGNGGSCILVGVVLFALLINDRGRASQTADPPASVG